MKAPPLKTAMEWRKLYSGKKALILSPASKEKPNSSFLLLAAEPAPEGLFRFHGFLD